MGPNSSPVNMPFRSPISKGRNKACRVKAKLKNPRDRWEALRLHKDCRRFSLSHRTRRAVAPSQRVGEGFFAMFIGPMHDFTIQPAFLNMTTPTPIPNKVAQALNKVKQGS